MNLYSIHKDVLVSYWWLSYLATFTYVVCLLWHYKHSASRYLHLPHNHTDDSRGRSKLFLAWNCGLALFSALGSLHTAPHIWTFTQKHSMAAFLCGDPFDIVGEGAWARWSFLFVCSKYVELMDTAFIVWRRKKVTFLHCYHHSSVLMFVWHAFIVKLSSGMIFTSINYLVHTLMYTYYAQSTLCLRRPAWGKLVTSAQLLQMLLGLATTVWHISLHLTKTGCESDLPTLRAALVLYLSYFCLFLHFSMGRYFYSPQGKDNSHPGAAASKED